MSYEVSPGMPAEALAAWLEQAAHRFGTFKDGRVDYTQADIAPIIMCTVMHKDKLLLVKRGYGLADAEGYWSTVNGFIDEVKPLTEQVKQELREELGVEVSNDQIRIGESYTLHNPKGKRRYIVFPCRVVLIEQPNIVLDREHTTFAWIQRKELESYHILDDLPYAVDAALAA